MNKFTLKMLGGLGAPELVLNVKKISPGSQNGKALSPDPSKRNGHQRKQII